MNREQLALINMQELDSCEKVFQCTEKIERGYKKIFRFVKEDERLLAYARDTVAMYSDCFLIYAVAFMGVATRESIEMFLKAMVAGNKELAIVFEQSKSGMDNRLKNLCDLGFLFMFKYETEVYGDNGEFQSVTLYTVIEAGAHIVRQRLQKVNLRINTAIQYKPIDELIGWAAAGYIGAQIAQSNGFNRYLDRVFTSRNTGTAYFPFELENIVDGTAYYIAVFDCFLYHNKMIHTDADYAELCAHKLNVVLHYLMYRTKKGVSIACIVVRDSADLMEFARLVRKVTALRGYLDRIYLTGEGIVRANHGDMSRSFLRLIWTDEDEWCRFECVRPPFI